MALFATLFSINADDSREIIVHFKAFDETKSYEQLEADKERDVKEFYHNIGAKIEGAKSVMVSSKDGMKELDAATKTNFFSQDHSIWGAKYTIKLPDGEGVIKFTPYRGADFNYDEGTFENGKDPLTKKAVEFSFDATTVKDEYIVFEGSIGGKDEIAATTEPVDFAKAPYIKIDASAVNFIGVVFTPLNNYPNSFGFYSWNHKGDPTQWQSYTSEMKTYGEYLNSRIVATHILYNDDADFGCLCYSGPEGDNGKVTNDVKVVKANGEKFKNGEFAPVYIQYKTMPQTDNKNVVSYDKYDEFYKLAVQFRFEEANYARMEGTYALSPTTVQVEFSSPFLLDKTLDTNKDEDYKKGQALLKKYLKFYEAKQDGEKLVPNLEKEIPTKEITFKKGETGISKLVAIMQNPIDNSKDTFIVYNATEDTLTVNHKTVEGILDVDKEKPVITFSNPKLEAQEKPVVEINVSKKFNPALIPSFTVTDNRDGDITEKIYVPDANEGNELRFVNIKKPGEYEVVFKVLDDWGNAQTRSVIFKVVK